MSRKHETRVPESVQSVLRSPGEPLPDELQAQFGRQFQHDFSRVRVHTDGEAEHAAGMVVAEAFTVGEDIVFGEGRYEPGSGAGRRLLAHELTHVVQQTGSDAGVRAFDAETDADSAADTAEEDPIRVQASVSTTVQRSPLTVKQALRRRAQLQKIMRSEGWDSWSGVKGTLKYRVLSEYNQLTNFLERHKVQAPDLTPAHDDPALASLRQYVQKEPPPQPATRTETPDPAEDPIGAVEQRLLTLEAKVMAGTVDSQDLLEIENVRTTLQRQSSQAPVPPPSTLKLVPQSGKPSAKVPDDPNIRKAMEASGLRDLGAESPQKQPDVPPDPWTQFFGENLRKGPRPTQGVRLMIDVTFPERQQWIEGLIKKRWTGDRDELDITGVIDSMPPEQAAAMIDWLENGRIGNETVEEAIDRVTDEEENLEVHIALTKAYLRKVGPEQAITELESAPVLPWHDVWGVGADTPAAFRFRQLPNGRIEIDYFDWVPSKADDPVARDIKALSPDMRHEAFVLDPNQLVKVRDRDQNRTVVLRAKDLIAYQHIGERKFAWDVGNVGVQGVLLGAGAASVGIADGLQLLLTAVEESRLTLQADYPGWGEELVRLADAVSLATNLNDGAQLVQHAGTKIARLRELGQRWREARRASGSQPGQAVAADKLDRLLERADADLDRLAKAGRSPAGGTVSAPAAPGSIKGAVSEAPPVRAIDAPSGTSEPPASAGVSPRSPASAKKASSEAPPAPLSDAPSATAGRPAARGGASDVGPPGSANKAANDNGPVREGDASFSTREKASPGRGVSAAFPPSSLKAANDTQPTGEAYALPIEKQVLEATTNKPASRSAFSSPPQPRQTPPARASETVNASERFHQTDPSPATAPAQPDEVPSGSSESPLPEMAGSPDPPAPAPRRRSTRERLRGPGRQNWETPNGGVVHDPGSPGRQPGDPFARFPQMYHTMPDGSMVRTFRWTDVNIQNMLDGKAPTGADGHPIELHHVDQNPNEIIELTYTRHKEQYGTIHGSEISRRDLYPGGYTETDPFDEQRKRYWRTRARDYLRAKGKRRS